MAFFGHIFCIALSKRASCSIDILLIRFKILNSFHGNFFQLLDGSFNHAVTSFKSRFAVATGYRISLTIFVGREHKHWHNLPMKRNNLVLFEHSVITLSRLRFHRTSLNRRCNELKAVRIQSNANPSRTWPCCQLFVKSCGELPSPVAQRCNITPIC